MTAMPSQKAFFDLDPDGVFVGNDPARGPWSADHCHAGPVAGLIVRAAEAETGPEKMLTRLTVDLIRPLPLAGLRVAAETTRHTRTLATTRVTVHDLDNTLCATATTMHLVRKDLGEVPTAEVHAPAFHDLVTGDFPLMELRHDLHCFAQAVDVAYPKGGNQGLGPKTIWLRTPHLLGTERPSPVQSLCPLADCGNGISCNVQPSGMGFMNTDLTLHIHREPVSDWLAAESVSHWQPNGIGMSQAILYDTQGPVGTALQTLVLLPPR